MQPEELIERAKDAPPREPRGGAPARAVTAAAVAIAAAARRQSVAAGGIRSYAEPAAHGPKRAASGPAMAGILNPDHAKPSWILSVSDYTLTALDYGAVITSAIEGVRSAAIGLWIGAGSRTSPGARRASRTSSSTCCSRARRASTRCSIAELFDTMGGELNAATSRETTVVYTRVPDDQIELALDVMTDMVFHAAFPDIDSEREVVLEEIAMVEDNPRISSTISPPRPSSAHIRCRDDP